MGGHVLLTHRSPQIAERCAGAQALSVGLLPVGMEMASSAFAVLLWRGHCLPVRVAQCPRGSLLAHAASWGDGWPATTISPSLVSQRSCTWPRLQKKLACPCSHTLPSLSPLQMARAKPTIALTPPPASKSSPPAGENPEHIFLEIIFPRAGQPRAGHRRGARYENQLGRTEQHQKKREKENPTGCQTPSLGQAAPRHFCCLCRAWTGPAKL